MDVKLASVQDSNEMVEGMILWCGKDLSHGEVSDIMLE